MGFAEEVKQNHENKGNVPVIDVSSEPSIDPESVKALMGEGEPQAEPVENSGEPQAESASKETFRIGTQEFSSLDEAMKYAAKLELEKAERDAYELGKQEVQPQQELEPPKKSIEDEIQDLLFDDPAEALRRYKEHITSEIKTSIKTETTAEQEKAAAWNSFYEENPDLTEHKELVDFVLEKNWDKLGTLEAKQGLTELAKMTKGMLQKVAQSQIPKEVLEDKKVVVTQASGEKTTPQPTVEDLVDFTTQIRRLNKRQLK